MKKLALLFALSAAPAFAQTAPSPQETQTAIIVLRQQREALADQSVQLAVEIEKLRHEIEDLKKASATKPAPTDPARK